MLRTAPSLWPFAAACLAAILLACGANPVPRPVPGGEEFGAGLTLKQVSSLRDVVANPEAYADGPVLLEGRVREVCQRRGCWLVLSDGEASLRVRFLDYAFFVPRDAAGRRAYVEGRVERETLDEDTARHYAEETPGGDPDAIHGPQEVVSFTASGVRLLARD